MLPGSEVASTVTLLTFTAMRQTLTCSPRFPRRGQTRCTLAASRSAIKYTLCRHARSHGHDPEDFAGRILYRVVGHIVAASVAVRGGERQFRYAPFPEQ